MTETERTSDELQFNRSLLGLFYLGEQQNDKCYSKDGACNNQSRSGIGDTCVLGHLTNEGAHHDVYSNSSSRVECSTYLNQLVTGLATATQNVEQGVDHSVEHAHAQTTDECATEVYPIASHYTTQVLEYDACQTYQKGSKSSLLVAQLGDKHTTGNTHHEVSNKVGIVADLSCSFRCAELVFYDGCHR